MPRRRHAGRLPLVGQRHARRFRLGHVDGEAWLTSELASFACAACGQAYGQERIRLIAQRDDLFFLDLACGHCGSQAVAIVTVQIDEETASIEPGEAALAGQQGVEHSLPPTAPPLSADDVLDMHRILGGFEGDTRQLLARLDGEAG